MEPYQKDDMKEFDTFRWRYDIVISKSEWSDCRKHKNETERFLTKCGKQMNMNGLWYESKVRVSDSRTI